MPNITLEFLDDDFFGYRYEVLAANPEEAKNTSGGVTVRLDGARLARPSSSYIPIAIGTRSPQVMRLAGEIADIALVGARNFTESTVERYKGWLAEGAERVGRNPEEIEVAPRVTLCISDDSKAAISSLKRYAAHYLDIIRRFSFRYWGAWQTSELRQCIRRRGYDSFSRLFISFRNFHNWF